MQKCVCWFSFPPTYVHSCKIIGLRKMLTYMHENALWWRGGRQKKAWFDIRNKKNCTCSYGSTWMSGGWWFLLFFLENSSLPAVGFPACRFFLSFSLFLSTFVVDASVIGLRSVTWWCSFPCADTELRKPPVVLAMANTIKILSP